MSIPEILSNIDARREAFPVTRRQIYCAHAAVAPLPKAVADAMRSYLAAATDGHQELAVPAAFSTEARQRAARLLNAATDEVALIGPTSLALSLAAGSLPLKPGDNIVIYADDYPSNVYPWLAWRERGVEVRSISTRELGRIEPEDVLKAINARTRFVALSTAHYLSGWRIDAAAIGQRLRERGILFCLDAIQSLGAFPLDARCADIVAAGGHKWLLGPCGSGLLYVRRELQPQLHPPVYGWNNLQCPDFVASDRIDYAEGMNRFECGTTNLAGQIGLSAAMQLLLDADIAAIADRLLEQRAFLVEQLRHFGFNFMGGNAPASRTSGILSFTHPDADMARAYRFLMEQGVIASLRRDRTGKSWLRLSPHFYTGAQELDQLASVLARIQ